MHSSPFAAPVVSSSQSANAPESGGAQLTISGLQFGISEPSASLSLASASCSTTSWTSATSAACTRMSNTAGQAFGLRIVVAAIIGTGSSIVFDASPTPSPSPRCDDPQPSELVGTIRCLKGFVVCSQPDDGLSDAGANSCSISLALDAGGGLHGWRLVELGHLLGHMRRRHRVSHTRRAEANCRQRGPVPGDLDGEAVQHGSLPRRLRHQSAVKV